MPELVATLSIIMYVSLVASILDIGMNGARYAAFAPYGVVISIVCCLILLSMGVK